MRELVTVSTRLRAAKACRAARAREPQDIRHGAVVSLRAGTRAPTRDRRSRSTPLAARVPEEAREISRAAHEALLGRWNERWWFCPGSKSGSKPPKTATARAALGGARR